MNRVHIGTAGELGTLKSVEKKGTKPHEMDLTTGSNKPLGR